MAGLGQKDHHSKNSNRCDKRRHLCLGDEGCADHNLKYNKHIELFHMTLARVLKLKQLNDLLFIEPPCND